MSITLPSDFVQFEMEWDPEFILPGHKDTILPEFESLLLHGHSSTPLASLQAMAIGSTRMIALIFQNYIAYCVIVALVAYSVISSWVLFKLNAKLNSVLSYQTIPPMQPQPLILPTFQMPQTPAITYSYPQTAMRRAPSIHTICPMEEDYAPMEHVSSTGGKSVEPTN